MDGARICVGFSPAPLREALSVALTAAGATIEPDAQDDAECDCWVVYCDTEGDWERAESFAATTPTVVVVVPRFDLDLIVRALALGCGVAALDTSTEVLVDVVRAAVRAEALVPLAVTTALARHEPPRGADVEGETLTELEEWLLAALVEGQTTTEMAASVGYSQRTVARRLQGLYLKLGVRNRAEAVARSTEHRH